MAMRFGGLNNIAEECLLESCWDACRPAQTPDPPSQKTGGKAEGERTQERERTYRGSGIFNEKTITKILAALILRFCLKM